MTLCIGRYFLNAFVILIMTAEKSVNIIYASNMI